MTEFLVEYITEIIAAGGYGAVVFFMVLESMVFPVPSEAVMPFAGFLVSDGTFTFWGALVAATVGSVIGSLLSYVIGVYGGRPFLHAWGKYFLLNQHHLDVTEQFFARYGEWTVFISRFIPVVRHLISIPAGIAEMPLGKFVLYTTIGAGMWNAILLYVGMVLGRAWDTIGGYMHYVDIAVVALIIAAVVFFIYARLKRWV